MKKLIFFLIILLLPLASAISVDMKGNYSQSETMIIKISGTFTSSILPENIYFYRGHIQIPLLYDISKINNDYYLYAIAPNTDSPYTLKIKNINYREGSQTFTNDIEENFTVSSSEASFNVYPGFIITGSDFLIQLENLAPDFQVIDIKSPFSSISKIPLESGEVKTVGLSIPSGLNASLYTIELSSSSLTYSIPVLLTKNSLPLQKEMRFSPPNLNISLDQYTNKTFIINLNNIGEVNLTDINLSLKGNIQNYISLDSDYFENLSIGSSSKVRVFVIPTDPGFYSGSLQAQSPDAVTIIPIYLTIFPQKSDNFSNLSFQNKSKDSYEEEKTCTQLQGEFCSPNTQCICNQALLKEGKCEEILLDGKCCRGQCVQIPSSSSSSPYWGWGLLLVAFMAIVYFAWSFFKKR